MRFLTNGDILAVEDRTVKEYWVEEWGGAVRIVEMSVAQRLEFDAKHMDSTGKFKNYSDTGLIYDMIRSCLVDEDNVPLFTDDTVECLGDKNAKVVQRIFKEVLKINYLDEESVKELKKN